MLKQEYGATKARAAETERVSEKRKTKKTQKQATEAKQPRFTKFAGLKTNQTKKIEICRLILGFSSSEMSAENFL